MVSPGILPTNSHDRLSWVLLDHQEGGRQDQRVFGRVEGMHSSRLTAGLLPWNIAMENGPFRSIVA